jgi:hypothetical protein
MNAMKRGGNVLVSIAYQNYLEKLVYPIRDDIILLKREHDIRIPVAAELTKELFGIGRARVAYMTDNLKNIRKTLDIMMPQVAGGGHKTLEEIFDDIRDRRIIVIPNDKYEERNSDLPTLKDDVKLRKTEEFVAIQGNYLTDRNMNLYSVLDKYILTEEDRDKFKDLDSTENDSYQYKYCKMRELLLDHDRLYTEYTKLKPEYDSMTQYGLEDTEELEQMESLDEEVDTLQEKLSSLFPHSLPSIPLASPPAKSRKNTGDLSHSVNKKLRNIRSTLFRNYISASQKAPFSHLKLEAIEMKEAAETLASLSKEEVEDNKSWDEESQKEIKELIDALVEIKSAGLFGMNTEGGRRTRRAKKGLKRKTRRHKK